MAMSARAESDPYADDGDAKGCATSLLLHIRHVAANVVSVVIAPISGSKKEGRVIDRWGDVRCGLYVDGRSSV
jgi:hypothetical protein